MFDLDSPFSTNKNLNRTIRLRFLFVEGTVGEPCAPHKTMCVMYHSAGCLTFAGNSIAERDNYTCQICGKYMPDGVGLHIDHIVPIKKGGKSVPSNLRVLCSKCNGRKSSN